MSEMKTYPEVAGWTDPTTSREAAELIEASGRAGDLRRRVLEWLNAGNMGTVDEIADALDEPFRSVQPRVSELRTQGLVVASGVRRHSKLGGRAKSHVWKIAEETA